MNVNEELVDFVDARLAEDEEEGRQGASWAAGLGEDLLASEEARFAGGATTLRHMVAQYREGTLDPEIAPVFPAALKSRAQQDSDHPDFRPEWL